MATVLASSIVDRAQVILQDTTGVRWPSTELSDWLNDGQREVVLIRPYASITNSAKVLTAGSSKQDIPSDGVLLLDVTRNMGADGSTPGNAIRLCAREVLDAQRPGWHTETSGGYVVHFVYDPRDPKHFYVYPKAPAYTWYVEIVYSSAPATIAKDGNGDPVGYITIDDIYANALVDYVLYRAYSKDAEYAGNAQRAIAHYTAFQNSLGVKTKNEMDSNPNLTVVGFNPNVAGSART